MDLSDLGRLATYYGTLSGSAWIYGDFDYDGDVDLADLGSLATNYDAGEAQAYADFAALVPEPACAAALLTLSAILQRRCGGRRVRTVK